MKNLLQVTFSKPSPEDYKEFADSYAGSSVLDGRTKVTATDAEGHTAAMFIDEERLQRLGEEYIKTHLTIYYINFFENWYLKLSENDYYNDPQRHPEKIIRLKFVEIENGTGREIYKGIDTGRYYLRECEKKEDFAKWYICGKRRHTDDGDEPRPNLIFEYNGQTEKIRFDDWNGVAAYSDTFNKNFNRREK